MSLSQSGSEEGNTKKVFFRGREKMVSIFHPDVKALIGVEGVLGLCGGVSRVTAEVATNPLNVAKTMVQQPNGRKVFFDAVRSAPFRTLSRGVGAQLVSAPFVGAGTFWALEVTRKRLKPGDDFASDFLAAAAGTLVSILVSQPFSIINDSVLANRFPNFMKAVLGTPLSKILSPRTYLAIAASKVPNNATMWSISELLRNKYKLNDATSAALAATFSVCLTAPLDTVKVRFTTGSIQSGINNPFYALYSIAKTEGLSALFVAAPARCLAVVPMFSIQIHTYQALKRIALSEEEEEKKISSEEDAS